MIGYEDKSYLVSGTYDTIIDNLFIKTIYYTQHVDVKGNVLWQKDDLLYAKHNSRKGFISVSYVLIEYYDKNGKLIWSIDNYPYTQYTEINCNDGITYAFDSNNNNTITIIRTDGNGKFE